jgi:hypothetical protein
MVLSEDDEAEVKAEVNDRRAAEEDTVLAEAQEGEVREEEVMAAGPQPLTAHEAREAAAAAGLELVLSSSSQSGFKGVYRHDGKYEAVMRVNGEKRYLGRFATPEEAALSYARHIGGGRAAAEPGEEDVLQAEEDSEAEKAAAKY